MEFAVSLMSYLGVCSLQFQTYEANMQVDRERNSRRFLIKQKVLVTRKGACRSISRSSHLVK